MQHVLLIMAGLLAAPGGNSDLEGWEYEPLRDDARVSALFDHSVVSMNDQPIGEVRDVTLEPDGHFDSLSVEFDHAGGDAFAMARFEWADVSLRAGENDVVVALGNGAETASFSVTTDGTSLQKLLGLPVLLQGGRFGEVSDVLYDPREERATALLVEATEGTTYALPLGSVSVEEKHVRLRFSEEEVRRLGQFETT